MPCYRDGGKSSELLGPDFTSANRRERTGLESSNSLESECHGHQETRKDIYKVGVWLGELEGLESVSAALGDYISSVDYLVRLSLKHLALALQYVWLSSV